MAFPILSTLIFLPLAGGLCLFLLPRSMAWAWSLFIAIAEFIVAIGLGLAFVAGSGTYQFTEYQLWIRGLGLNYSLGVDGISLFLVLLTALLSAVAIGASAKQGQDARAKLYFFLMLLLTTGITGVFLANNVFLFYVFWEIMLIPSYLLIGTFGGPRRTYAAMKFVIFTAVGSLLMLAGVIGLGVFANSGGSLDLPALLNHVPANAQMALFLAFSAAFAVKSPLFPFHSWLPDAYSEAPTPVTVLLAGAMSKTGTYGFLRFVIPLFPNAVQQARPVLLTLIVIGILYSAMQALVQNDFKKLLAFSSISHIGVILLGIFALNTFGIEGAVLQMVNHGITTGALFLIAGSIETRVGTRSIRVLGGMATKVPVLAVTFCIAALSSLGLPGLNSFTGEFLALLGAFQANAVFGVLGTLVVIPAAWYLLRFFQGVMEGKSTDIVAQQGVSGTIAGGMAGKKKNPGVQDISLGEFAVILPLLALIVVIGLIPHPIPDRIEPSLPHVLPATSAVQPTSHSVTLHP